MTTSKELVEKALKFQNPERGHYNFDSNRTPVIAEKYGQYPLNFSSMDPSEKRSL